MTTRSWSRTAFGRRWLLSRRTRPAERRALSWFWVGPARGGTAHVYAEQTTKEAELHGPITGVAVAAGRWVWVLTWPRLGIRRTAA